MVDALILYRSGDWKRCCLSLGLLANVSAVLSLMDEHATWCFFELRRTQGVFCKNAK